MSLTPEEKQRIYEEERERFNARERILAEQSQQPRPARAINWVIILGFLVMLYVFLTEGR